MKIGIIIQARMGSSRLPGKILKKIKGKSLLELQFNRLKHAKRANIVLIATSSNTLDDCVEELCNKLGIPCYRGPEKDVLQRYFEAAKYFNIDTIIRINGDCPFIDAEEIDKMIGIWESNSPGVDYVSNILEETFPLGMHIEIFSLSTIKIVLSNILKEDEREHVTPYIYRNPQKFNIMNISSDEDLSSYRWTVDYLEDFNFVKEVYDRFGINNSSFTMKDLINLIKLEPSLGEINNKYEKKQNLL